MPELPTIARLEDTAVSVVAASVAVRPLLDGPPTPLTPLGTPADVTWLQADGYVLALSGPTSTWLPNGVAVGRRDVLTGVTTGWVVGNGQLEAAGLVMAVSRWWDPRPVLGGVSGRALADTSQRAADLMGADHRMLGWAMTPGAAVADAALGLLGRGPGLTPEGDDFVMGLLAGLRLLGQATRSRPARELLRTLAPVVTAAPSSTTSLSATLIRHAWRGEVASPLGALLQALTGRGHVEDAVAELTHLGATSGMAMGRGALAAAHHVAGGVRDDR